VKSSTKRKGVNVAYLKKFVGGPLAVFLLLILGIEAYVAVLGVLWKIIDWSLR
jgi:hypothetical protein